jgi:hypothetical protein
LAQGVENERYLPYHEVDEEMKPMQAIMALSCVAPDPSWQAHGFGAVKSLHPFTSGRLATGLE